MQVEGRISEVLRSKNGSLVSVPPDATVYHALELIAGKDIGSVLVMEGDALLGVFSEREYARNVALQGRHSRETKITDVMFAPPITITPETRIDEAMRIMTEHHIRHLPVLTGGTVVGIISIGDVVKWIITEQERTIEQLQSYITGQYDTVLTRVG